MTTALIGNPIPLINHANGFPHAVHLGVIKVVSAAVRHAWATLCANPALHLVPPNPGAPEEDRYTESLCQILDQMLQEDSSSVAGFSGTTFHSVSRSESTANYSGANLNKQPDILIRLAEGPLVEARRFVGIYIEAKVVSMSHGISKYTKDGLFRFVEGEYSWAMQDGIMLGYQRVKHRPIGSLAQALETDATLACVADASGIYLDQSSHKLPGLGCSKHNRSWKYVGGGDPGAIRVWHLWDLAIP